MTALQVIWYFLVGLLLAGYALLDGFDLGTGWWYLRAKKPEHRRHMLAAIGPVWDGNEVWLITGGGALFAAFPKVYATVFSGMYLALILVLFGLILRATAIEFRSQIESPAWRNAWDWAFGVGSLLPALLYGVAVGNLVLGMKLDGNGDYIGSFFDLLNPYALICGLLGLSTFIVHGGLYQILKLEGEARENIKSGLLRWWKITLALFVVLGPATALLANHMFVNFMKFPSFFLLPSFILGGIIMIWVSVKTEKYKNALIYSGVAVLAEFLTLGTMMFPNFVWAKDPALHLTAFNSSSSRLTLIVMLIIVLLGMPLVLAYNIWVYKSFAGKVRDEDLHY